MWNFQVKGIDDEDAVSKVACHLYDVTALATHQNERAPFVISASNDRTAKVWSPDGAETNSLSNCGILTGVDVSPDGRLCVTSSWDKRANVWNLGTGEITSSMHDSGGVIKCCIFHPDGSRILTGGTDNTVKVWGIDTEDLVGRPFSKHTEAVSSLAIFPDGRFFVSGSFDGKAVLWDLDCNMDMWEYTGHQDKILAVAVMPDGTGVVTASSDCTARLWSRDGPTELRCYGTLKQAQDLNSASVTGHSAAVTGVAVSKDSTRLVTCSEDYRAILWNVRTGDSLCHFDMETKVLCCSIVHAGGQERIILGGANGRMMFLRVTGSSNASKKGLARDSKYTVRRKGPQGAKNRPKKALPAPKSSAASGQGEGEHRELADRQTSVGGSYASGRRRLTGGIRTRGSQLPLSGSATGPRTLPRPGAGSTAPNQYTQLDGAGSNQYAVLTADDFRAPQTAFSSGPSTQASSESQYADMGVRG